MENKVDNFLKEFNERLGKLNCYSDLEYITNGNTEGLNLPQINVWNDQASPTEFFKQTALSQILKVTSDWSVVAEELFAEEIDKWEKEVKKQLKEKFTYAKIKIRRVSLLRYEIIVSGKYNECAMEKFIENIVVDFEYMFEGCSLDYEY